MEEGTGWASAVTRGRGRGREEWNGGHLPCQKNGWKKLWRTEHTPVLFVSYVKISYLRAQRPLIDEASVSKTEAGFADRIILYIL